MPKESALQRKLSGPWATWGVAEELAAQNVEVTQALWRLLVIRWSKKGTRPPELLHIPRPGEKKKGLATKAEMVEFFKGGGSDSD